MIFLGHLCYAKKKKKDPVARLLFNYPHLTIRLLSVCLSGFPQNPSLPKFSSSSSILSLAACMIHLTAYQKNLVRFAACVELTISREKKSSSFHHHHRWYPRRHLGMVVVFIVSCFYSFRGVLDQGSIVLRLLPYRYPVTHQFGEPIVFFFAGGFFILEQDLGILSFCCFICILLL